MPTAWPMALFGQGLLLRKCISNGPFLTKTFELTQPPYEPESTLLKEGSVVGDYIGDDYRVTKGDTRSLDYSSYKDRPLGLCRGGLLHSPPITSKMGEESLGASGSYLVCVWA